MFRDLQGSFTWEKLFITVFEFFGQFFFQNDVIKPRSLVGAWDQSIPIERLGSFQLFLIL
jgi:hypothetical protein